MKNNHTIVVILYAFLSNLLIYTGPSGRQTSKTRVPAPEVMVEKSAPPKGEPKKVIIEKKDIAPSQTVKKELPLKTASSQKNQALYELFDKKLNSSSHLTEGIIQYVFESVLDELDQDSNKADKKQLQTIKGYFYGLRYPIYRHLREVISACSDPNAFLCGGIINYITTLPYNAHEKELLLTDLKNLGATLKKFKFYQIDNQLEDELKKHLDQVEAMISKKSINQSERAIIQSYYIAPLTLLKKYIALPEIKAILPNRESSLYYGYRKAAKKVVTTGISVADWLRQRVANHLVSKAFKTFNSYVPDKFKIKQTSLDQKADAFLFQGIETVLSDPKTLITVPLEVVAKPFRGINALWQKPTLILEGLKYTRENFIPGIKSGGKWTIFNIYELAMNRYFGARRLNRWLTTALRAAQKTVSPNVTAITPTDLQTENLNFMTMSAAFVNAYAQQLCNAIIQSSMSLPESTAVLQSAQIEIFRHRRTIISELSNKHAFTYNFFLDEHEAFARDFTRGIYASIANSIKENNLTISEDEVIEKAEEIVKDRLSKKNELLNFRAELTTDDYEMLDQLARQASTDPSNNDYLMYLATPINGRMLGDMIEKFENHLKKIVDELKSFGARSRNQLIQNYWLSVIDKSYGKKLQGHLEALGADLNALMADANHTVNVRDINENIYCYTDKNDDGNPIPIGIPSPKVPTSSAQELEAIIRIFYINPLTEIATQLQQEDIVKKLPADKNWYIKYPIYATKLNIKFQKKAIASAIDNLTIDNLIAIGTAFSTGGISAVGPAVLSTMSFSAIALGMLDIDFINPPPSDSYLTSAVTNAVFDLLINKGPKGVKKYTQGKTVTKIISDIATKSGPVKKVKEALREYQRTARSN